MQDKTYISVPKSPNFKVTKKYPRTQFSKYRFKNESASVSKRRASKLRLKTARKSRLILNKSWFRDKLSNYTPFDFLPGSPLSKKSRKYPSRKYLSRIYPSRIYLTLLSSCPHRERGLQLTGGVPTQRIDFSAVTICINFIYWNYEFQMH